jgi:hypothetical protein
MALFKAYTYTPREIHAYDSVWNSKKKQFIAIKSMDEIDVHMVLDGISLAIEAGVGVRPSLHNQRSSSLLKKQ